MDIKLGDLIIQRTLDEQENQLLYLERIYIVLAVDEAKKQITTVLSVDWICGYQRDMAHNYNSLLEDGYSIEIIEHKDIYHRGIYKKLDSSTFQMIGHEYFWFEKENEKTACVPYVHLFYNHKLRGHIITTYSDEFSAAMELYPKGNEEYIFGKNFSNIILPPSDIAQNVHTLGNKISKK